MAIQFEKYRQFLTKDGYAVFLFHGVVSSFQEDCRNYTRKHIEAQYFHEFLDDLVRAGARPVSMDEILAAKNGFSTLPKWAFAITFDDGFENNLSVAMPILKKFSVPATIYVTTEFVDKNLMSWIDRIEWAFKITSCAELKLPWLEAQQLRTLEEKIAVLEQIRKKVKFSSDIDPNWLADYVQESLGVPHTITLQDELNLKLNWEQIKFLSKQELVTIGGHSHTHQILSYLDDQALNFEIFTSIEMLQQNICGKLHHFSYPEGLSQHFSQRCIDVLRAAGILICPSAIPGVNDNHTDLFHINRISVT